MHPKVIDAFDEIDAAVFSGDSFHDKENAEVLQSFINRWQRELVRIQQEAEDPMWQDQLRTRKRFLFFLRST